MSKEGQNYETSGQLLLSRLLGNNDVMGQRRLCHLTCHTCLKVPSEQKNERKHDYAAYSALAYVMEFLILASTLVMF